MSAAAPARIEASRESSFMTSTLETTPTPTLTDIVRQTTAALGSSAPTLSPSRISAHLVAGTNTTVALRARDHEFIIDEPEFIGGRDSGATPVEHLLGALGACQIITVKIWAATLGLVVDDISFEAEGGIDFRGFFGLDPDVRPGFQGIDVRLTVTGPETDEAYAELIRLVEDHCPVLDNLVNPLPVRASVN